MTQGLMRQKDLMWVKMPPEGSQAEVTVPGTQQVVSKQQN